MKIAIEGCGHGELDKIYETIAFIEEQDKVKIDLLLCCGDFQAVRNKSDLKCMAVPSKYQKLNTFYKYYSGEKKAPVLTIFIGGNHEASNYLQELSYGGWVAPNIYYMGYGSVVQFGGVRIAGLSGIYKGRDYLKGHFEKPPYSEDTKRSVYHIRILEVFRFKQISRPIDVMLTHDWPRGIYNYGDAHKLIRYKKHFKEEVETDTLGSPPAEELLYKLKPDYWFSAHLHVKFAAVVQHKSAQGKEKSTKFLALDKCLPNRKFLQVLDIAHDSDKPLQLELDPEWLCILKSTNHLLNTSHGSQYMPGPGCSERYDFTVTDEEIKHVIEEFGSDLSIPDNFEKTTPAYNSDMPNKAANSTPHPKINPQTSLMCEMLGITDPLSAVTGLPSTLAKDVGLDTSVNPDEIALDDEEEDEDDDEEDVKDDGVVSDDDVDDTDDSSANYSSFITSFSVDGGNDTLESSCLSTDEDAVPLQSGDDSQSDAPKSSDSDSNIMEKVQAKSPVETDSTKMEKLSFDDTKTTTSDSNPEGGEVSTSTSPSKSRPLSSDSPLNPDKEEPKVKKFKRRNVAMYSITGDNSYG